MEKWLKKTNRLALDKDYVKGLKRDIRDEVKILSREKKHGELNEEEISFLEECLKFIQIRNVTEAYSYYLYLECYLNHSFEVCKEYAMEEVKICYEQGFVKDEYPGVFLLYEDDYKTKKKNDEMDSGHMFIAVGTFFGG